MPLDEGQHVGDRHPTAELLGQRRDARVGDAAGHEPVVPAEVHVAVEGEAVHGHAAADADADRGDLALGATVVRPEPKANPGATFKRQSVKEIPDEGQDLGQIYPVRVGHPGTVAVGQERIHRQDRGRSAHEVWTP